MILRSILQRSKFANTLNCFRRFHTFPLLFNSNNGDANSSVKIPELPRKGKAKQLIQVVNDTEEHTIKKSWRDDKNLPDWKRQKLALKEKLKGEKWNPSKKLSREQMESVRLLKRQLPNLNAGDIAAQMKVSPEVIRRILKSKWEPSEKELEDIQRRWKKRSERIIDLYEKGLIGDKMGTLPIARKVIIKGGNSTGTFRVRRTKDSVMSISSTKKGKHSEDKDILKAKNKLHLLMKK
ncbi:uncharacterized protein YNL213C [Kluyveromyces marxianus]|uniref:Required for respiratory growth protein 9, mitochondrial n=2 Tax=Kluyveromyces marxianus TaxID=4911 RepID=W0TGL2_KLUMD|nr:uncharacterized protein KLMA_50600 [Kluyveromyces marxianus DMKU3-1042]QGN16959.1 YNL213C [Kluyveromyces marxianus]BAO41254.1 uncharacterized protein YNL213C [Kluyveromyces marxianus DMKU3-1042]BAP72700.1 uncharacterized protein YNL213C [Kluyveromyces marxianus]